MFPLMQPRQQQNGTMAMLEAMAQQRNPLYADAVLGWLPRFVELGAIVVDAVLYRNVPVSQDQLPEFDAAVFGSGSAVNGFAEQFGPAALDDRTVVVIGKPTETAWRGLGRGIRRQFAIAMAPVVKRPR